MILVGLNNSLLCMNKKEIDSWLILIKLEAWRCKLSRIMVLWSNGNPRCTCIKRYSLMHIYGLIVLDWAHIMKIDIATNIIGVKPKWREYKESWIGLIILMLIHMCQSKWIKLKLDWSQHSYLEDNQARITILKKWFFNGCLIWCDFSMAQ